MAQLSKMSYLILDITFIFHFLMSRGSNRVYTCNLIDVQENYYLIEDSVIANELSPGGQDGRSKFLYFHKAENFLDYIFILCNANYELYVGSDVYLLNFSYTNQSFKSLNTETSFS